MRMRLTIDITYDEATITESEAREQLRELANRAADEGLMSGSGPGIVDEWEAKVERIDCGGY